MITCDLDGHLTWRPERDGQPASVGKICAWGGFTVAEISAEVPHGERDEYARKFAMVDRLVDALRASIDNMRVSAEKAGPLHAFWDDIFSAEALLKELDNREQQPTTMTPIAKQQRLRDELNNIIDAAMRSGDGDAAQAILDAGWTKEQQQ